MAEEYGIVLDVLPTHEREIVQILGEGRFTLLEVYPREGVRVLPGERVYVGKGERDKIEKIRRRITYNELSPGAKEFLPEAIEKIVKKREKDFVHFFNTCGSVSRRTHSLDFFPGVGRILKEKILEERDKKPFESFEDIRQRVKGFDPVKVLVEKILDELAGKAHIVLFVRV